MVTDHLSDFLARLSNAGKARQTSVQYPYTKFIGAVAEVLQAEGYLSSVEKRGKKARKLLEVSLAYDERKQPKLNGIARVSKPSRRVYSRSSRLHPVLNGIGRLIISTPKGIMTERTARKEHVGGELLFKIW